MCLHNILFYFYFYSIGFEAYLTKEYSSKA